MRAQFPRHGTTWRQTPEIVVLTAQCPSSWFLTRGSHQGLLRMALSAIVRMQLGPSDMGGIRPQHGGCRSPRDAGGSGYGLDPSDRATSAASRPQPRVCALAHSRASAYTERDLLPSACWGILVHSNQLVPRCPCEARIRRELSIVRGKGHRSHDIEARGLFSGQ